MAGPVNPADLEAPPGAAGYPVHLSIEYPPEVSRLTTFFRLFLAIPALFFLAVLTGGSAYFTRFTGTRALTIGAAGSLVVAIWMTVLVREEIPRWLFDFQVAVSRFTYRVYAYLALVTEQFPPFDRDGELDFDVEYEPRISRKRVVIWKIITALPHIVVLFFLSLASLVVIFISWWAILITGSFPRGLHKFVVGVMRWGARVQAYVQSLTDVFPPYSLDEHAGPGASEPLSAVLGCVLLVALVVGGVAAVAAIRSVTRHTVSMTVNYRSALSGTLSTEQSTLTLDKVTVHLQQGADPLTSDIIKAATGHRLVSYTLVYDNRRLLRSAGHHDLELNTVRVRTNRGSHDTILVTAGGVLAPIDVQHGQDVEVDAYFDVLSDERITELDAYTQATSGRHVAFLFSDGGGAAAQLPLDSSVPAGAGGSCVSATFSIVSAPDPARVFHDGETLSATVQYSAPGCSEIDATFGGDHVAGSPWFNYWCHETCTAKSFPSNIFAAPVRIEAPAGSVTLIGQPGAFPPKDVGSPPNLEGFHTCAVVLSATDGNPFGQRTDTQQIDLPCGL